MKLTTLIKIIFLLITLQSCDNTTIEETIAFSSKNEVWQDFRNKFPFHIQTIAITRTEKDNSFQLIISEPPPHVSRESIEYFFSPYKCSVDFHTHQLGVDGWVKDVSVTLDNLSEKKIIILIDELSELLFHTSYKAHVLDLSKTHLTNEEKKLDYQVSAAELESWLMTENELFHTIDNENESFPINEILNYNRTGVFYSLNNGFVIWSISKENICNSEKEARQFSIDSDLILGAISDDENIVIIGRERELSIFTYPPLRTETIMMLANANNDQLSQSYERNQMFAGKLDSGKDWAPIYLSDELKHTEYGSLLNITDQLLKSWSQNGETDYEFFNYQIPTEWAFEKPLSKSLNTRGVTFNWNTKGAAYLIEYDDHEVTALNRTGALPMSYFPEGDVDEYSKKQAKKMEETAYDYFANQNDPNLIRVVQYAALYQIFSHYNVGCSSYNHNVSKHNSRETEKELQRAALSFIQTLKEIDPEEVTSNVFGNLHYNIEKTSFESLPEDERLLLELLNTSRNEVINDYKSKIISLKNIVKIIEQEYGYNGLIIFSYIIANPIDIEGLKNTPIFSSSRFTETGLQEIYITANVFLETFGKVKMFNLNHFGVSIEKIPKELIIENLLSSRGWIKTPTILISWNADSLMSMGGHNLNSRVVPFEVDQSIKPGQYKIITDNGNKKVLIAEADIGKINSSFLKNVENTKFDGSKKFTNSKDVPIRKRIDVIPRLGKGIGHQDGNGNGQERGASRLKQNVNIKKGIDEFTFAESGKRYKVTEIEGKEFIQCSTNENILFPKAKLNDTEALIAKMRSRKYLKEEFSVISLVDDFKTNHILDNYFDKRNLSHSIKNISDLKSLFSQNNQKSFILFGHIENGKFAFGKDNSQTLSLSEAEVAARNANVNVFFFGCKSSFARKGSIKSGVANNIHSVEAASRLGFAIHKNSNIWGLFNDLAYEDVRIIISEEPLGDLGYIESKLAQQRVEAVLISMTSAGVLSGIILNGGKGDNGGDDDDNGRDSIGGKKRNYGINDSIEVDITNN